MTHPWSASDGAGSPTSGPPLATPQIPGVDGLPASPPTAGQPGWVLPSSDPSSAGTGGGAWWGGGGDPYGDDRSAATDRTLVVVSIVLAVALLAGLLLLARKSGVDAATSAGTSTTGKASTTTRAGSPTTAPNGGSGQPGQPVNPNDPNASSTTTTGPAGTTTTRPPVAPEVIQREVDQLTPWLEQNRGLKFKEPVTVEVLAPAAFDQLLDDLIETEAREDIEKQEVLLKAFGMIPGDLDLVATQKELLRASVLGFYNPKSKELVVEGVEINEMTRETIMHELNHALQDQHFVLERPQYEDRKDEIAFGLSALAEGDANRMEDLWEDELGPDRLDALTREQQDSAAAIDVTKIPPVLLSFLEAPYALGEPFVTEVFDLEGQLALDSLFALPPETSEQVIHDDKFERREKRIEVSPPPANGQVDPSSVIDLGVFGELATQLLLGPVVGKATGTKASTGWGGDWAIAWTQDEGDSYCGRIDWKMDTKTDLDELTNALKTWQKRMPGAEIENPTTDSVRATSCISKTGGGAESIE